MKNTIYRDKQITIRIKIKSAQVKMQARRTKIAKIGYHEQMQTSWGRIGPSDSVRISCFIYGASVVYCRVISVNGWLVSNKGTHLFGVWIIIFKSFMTIPILLKICFSLIDVFIRCSIIGAQYLIIHSAVYHTLDKCFIYTYR